MGTDAGTPLNLHGHNAQELRYMVENGISPLDAITISTSHGADLMRLSDHGRIREGAVADLIAVAGDPLEDIECVADRANLRFVLKRGQLAAGSLEPGRPTLHEAAE